MGSPLAKHGARWVPDGPGEINEARRSLVRMTPDYTVEFVWIMSGFNACAREDLEQLLRTTAIRALVSKHQSRIEELLESFPSSP